MTEDENKEFDLLQLADEMSHKNWLYFKFLYNKKFKEAEDQIKALEAAIFNWSNAITDWIGNDFIEQIEDEASRKLVKDVLDRAVSEENK